MSGDKIFLDTNAFIYFFEGRSKITELVVKTPIIYCSVISEIELLSPSHLVKNELAQIRGFLSLCRQVELMSTIVDLTIEIRQTYRLKIPDAIIAASALSLNAPLVSADTSFQKVNGLVMIEDILD